MILYADYPFRMNSSVRQVQPRMFAMLILFIKRHLCRLIYVAHFIVLLSRFDAIAETILTILTILRETIIILVLPPTNSDEKWILLSRKSMVYAFFNGRCKWVRKRRHVWWRGELWKHIWIVQVQLVLQRVCIQFEKKGIGNSEKNYYYHS